nr:hypothetical protein Iba_chr01cCG15480 [Ipomoea batatas]
MIFLTSRGGIQERSEKVRFSSGGGGDREFGRAVGGATVSPLAGRAYGERRRHVKRRRRRLVIGCFELLQFLVQPSVLIREGFVALPYLSFFLVPTTSSSWYSSPGDPFSSASSSSSSPPLMISRSLFKLESENDDGGAGEACCRQQSFIASNFSSHGNPSERDGR